MSGLLSGTGHTGKGMAGWRQFLHRSLDGIYFPRRFQSRQGRFTSLVSAGCQLNVLDPRPLHVAEAHDRFIDFWIKPDSVVWDIGANMGLFALPAALKAKSGRVIAFEPDIDIARHLQKSIRRSSRNWNNIQVVACGLSDTDGSAEFLVSGLGRSMNKIAGASPWHDADYQIHERRVIPILTIDTLADDLPAPDVIKIDAEGADYRVLLGGAATIKARRPVITVEAPSELSHELSEYFRNLDYVLLDGQGDFDEPLDTPVWDLVAAPREVWEARRT